MATETASDSMVYYKVISHCVSEQFGFKVCSDASVSSLENVCRMHCQILKFNYLTKIINH